MPDRDLELLRVQDNPHDVETTLYAFAQHHLSNKVHVVRDGAQALAPAEPATARPATAALRVLILEGGPGDCELMVHELRQSGFDPVWHRVDTEASYLARLQHLWHRDVDVPFIVASGTLADEQAAAVMKEGATDYLLKDRLARLGLSVASGLEACQQRQALREVETR